jgi:hypothetical protein
MPTFVNTSVQNYWVSGLHPSSGILDARKQTKLNSMALVRKRTIPTERPPLVGEVIVNFYG